MSFDSHNAGLLAGMFKCDLCQRPYQSPEARRRHRKIHLAGRQFHCVQCNATFARQDVYHRHIQQIHRVGEDEVTGGSNNTSSSVDSEDRRPANEGPPSSSSHDRQQRKRSRMACDLCWKKKERCDVGDPSSTESCSSCSRQNVSCLYSRPSKKIKVTMQEDFLPPTIDINASSGGDSALTVVPPSFAQSAQTSSADLQRLLRPFDSVPDPADAPLAEDNAFTLPFHATASAPEPPLVAAFDDDTGVLVGSMNTPSGSLQSQELPIEPFNTDLLQSWDWLMDEFIPSSPLLDPHRSTPWRWRSPNLDKQRHPTADLMAGSLPLESVLEPKQVPLIERPDRRTALQHERASQTAPDLESLADVCIGLDQDNVSVLASVAPTDQVSAIVTQTIAAEKQDNQACIYDLVHDCLDRVETLAPDASMRKHSSILVAKLGLQYESAASKNNSEHVLQSYVQLYFQRFHPLWPIFPVPLFGLSQCPAHLYLTLAIIGSQYGDQHDADFGQMAHQVFRTVLIGRELDMHEVVKSGEALCLTLLLNVATALYFGQRRSFYFAQQLKALLTLHAHRICLFDESRHEVRPSRSSTAADSSSCYPDVAQAEVRRRLAYGILRLDAYIALMMGQRPQVNVEDMRISMLGDPAWWQGPLPGNKEGSCGSTSHEADSDLLEAGTVKSYLGATTTSPSFALDTYVPDHKQVFCTVFRRFYHSGVTLHRVVDQELILFGLVPKVLVLSRQRYSLSPTICSVTEFDQKRRQDPDFLREPDMRSERSDEMADLYAISAPRNSCYQLDYPMAREWNYTLASLSRWREVFASTQANPHSLSTQDRHGLFHCHILYSCVTLHLFADMEELRSLSVLRQNDHQHPLYVRALRWSRTSDAKTAVCRVHSTLETVVEELANGQGAHFTFLSYVVIYHSAIVLWVSMQLVEAPRCFDKISAILNKAGIATRPASDLRDLPATDTQKMVMTTMLRIGDLYLRFNSLWPLVNNFRELVRDLAHRSLL